MRRYRSVGIFPLLILVLPTLGTADFSGRVVGVSDGDTITVLHDGLAVRIRLNGIDCPEKRQPFGQAAKRFTAKLVFGQVVTVRVKELDKYGRSVGEVLLPDGRSLNQELVRAGLAWWYRKYSDDRILAELEDRARRSRVGLWADADPIPPWVFRHRRLSSIYIGPAEVVA